MTEPDIVDFEEWGRATVGAAAALLGQRLGTSAHAHLGGQGGPRTTAGGYRSAFVRFTSPVGRLAVWLFCAPAGHAYSDSSSKPRLGAGVLDDSLRPLPQGTIRPPLGGRPSVMRWTRLSDDWASDLAYIDADVTLSPDESGQRLAGRAYEALLRLHLIG
jgi:hypothetical protein